MTFFELKKKLIELIDAYKAQSTIVKTDQSALKYLLLEVRRDMGEVIFLINKKESLEETLKETANEIDKQLKPEFDKVYDSNSIPARKKFKTLKTCSNKLNEALETGNLIIAELEKLEVEFSSKEVDKKHSELSSLWKEVKSIYNVDDFKDEIEIEISDSVAGLASLKEEEEEELGNLLEELKKEIKSEEKTEKKSGLFSRFSKKGA